MSAGEGRKKTRDFVHTHEVNLFPRPIALECRVRVYEAPGEIPAIVCSCLPQSSSVGITNDCEFIAAEVVMDLFPREALAARKRGKFFHWIEHYPDRSEECARLHGRPLAPPPEFEEMLDLVDFSDYRVRIGGRRRATRPRKALQKHTGAGQDRLTFGLPRWRRATREEVERRVGMTLDDTVDAPQRGLPSDLPGIRRGE